MSFRITLLFICFTSCLGAQSLSVGYNRILNSSIFEYRNDDPSQSNGVSFSFEKAHKKLGFWCVNYHFLSGKYKYDLFGTSYSGFSLDILRSYGARSHLMQVGHGLRLPIKKIGSQIGISYNVGALNHSMNAEMYYGFDDGKGQILNATDFYNTKSHWALSYGLDFFLNIKIHPQLDAYVSASVQYGFNKLKASKFVKKETPIEQFPEFFKPIVEDSRRGIEVFTKPNYEFFQAGLKYHLKR